MRARPRSALVAAGVVLAAATAAAQRAAPGASAQPRTARPSATAPATPATPRGDQAAPATRLGRPFPAPVQPPQPADRPGVHVGVVSPSESRFSKRLRGSRGRMGARRGGDVTGGRGD